jgi:hypothetical protein
MHKSGGLLLAACLASACGGRSTLSGGDTSDAAADVRLPEDQRAADREPQRVECVYSEDCHLPVTGQCVRIGDCAFEWPMALNRFASSVELDGVGTVPVTPPHSEWTISEDGRTLVLSGPTCEMARKAPALRITFEFIHSCIL